MGAKRKKPATKRQMAKDCRKSFEAFAAAHNAETVEKQTQQAENEAFAEKYLAAMRRKLGIE